MAMESPSFLGCNANFDDMGPEMMTDGGMEWDYDGNPNAEGWYAVLVCYDEQEGVIPMAAWWTGNAWKQKCVIAFGESRPTMREAEEVAKENDPGW